MTENEVKQGILDHIKAVHSLMISIAIKLDKRGKEHDASKLEEPEFSGFVEFTPRLAESSYGSDEYFHTLEEMKPILDHHYENNRHHPNYHKNGVNDMDLLDLIEMLCDWKAATLRHSDGDIKKSVEFNVKRYNIDPQLHNILLNSLWLVES